MRIFAAVKEKKSNITLVWLLITLLVFAITPKGIFHEFHEHEHEIEHVDLDCHNNHFEAKHNHCPVLNEVAPIFYAQAEILCVPHVKELKSHVIKSKDIFRITKKYLFRLKAPPTFLS